MSISITAALKLIDLVAFGASTANALAANAKAAKRAAKEFSETGRDPTELEWAALEARMQAAEDTIESRAEEARNLSAK